VRLGARRSQERPAGIPPFLGGGHDFEPFTYGNNLIGGVLDRSVDGVFSYSAARSRAGSARGKPPVGDNDMVGGPPHGNRGDGPGFQCYEAWGPGVSRVADMEGQPVERLLAHRRPAVAIE
jgi:hypothetical protein